MMNRACFVRIHYNLIAAICIAVWQFAQRLLLVLPLVCIRCLLISAEKPGGRGGKSPRIHIDNEKLTWIKVHIFS